MNKSDLFDTCLLCNRNEFRPILGYEKNYLVKCRSCGFVFCERKPSLNELKKHYSLYQRATSISEITLKRYNQLLDSFEPYRKTNNIIDVGCGDGHFLVVAKKRKWNVYGTEFTREAIGICNQKGIQMNEGPLDAEQYSPGFFDVITSFEVLEHINTPCSEIMTFHKILRLGGAVYITTPNFNSISRNILGPEWNIIEFPEHLSYYTKQTLTFLFKQNNFKPIRLSTTGISVNRLRASKGIKTKTFAVNTDEELRQKAEQRFLFKWIKNLANSVLNFSNKGDSMKALFQKVG